MTEAMNEANIMPKGREGEPGVWIEAKAGVQKKTKL